MLLRSVQSVPILAHIWTRMLLYLFSILDKGRVRKPKRESLTGTALRRGCLGMSGENLGAARSQLLSCCSRNTSGKSPGNRRKMCGKAGTSDRSTAERGFVLAWGWHGSRAWRFSPQIIVEAAPNTHTRTGGLRVRGAEKFYFAGNVDCSGKNKAKLSTSPQAQGQLHEPRGFPLGQPLSNKKPLWYQKRKKSI